MVKYYLTKGIYDRSNMLRLEVKYKKECGGYVAEINPCHKDEFSYGITYCKEYYDYYNALVCDLVKCGRRSEKKFNEACAIAEQKSDELIQSYVNHAYNKGGRYIEVIGELKGE